MLSREQQDRDDALTDPFRYEPLNDAEEGYWADMERGADEWGGR